MQTVSQNYHEMSQNSIVPVDWKVRVSFNKNFDDSVSWFTLDSSTLNGGDLLATSDDNPLQEWDYYDYIDYSDRLIAMQYTRELDFPYSVQSAIADITLNNFDGYFNPRGSSPIAQKVLPKRPIRLYYGYKNTSKLQQFMGLTQGMPEIDDQSKQVNIMAYDFLSELYAMSLTETVAMQEVTTDVVISAILEQFGLTPLQYSLTPGINQIPYVFFERGKSAGAALRELMQAEMGKLWLDEQGIIRFDNRVTIDNNVQMELNAHNIVSIKTVNADEIINTVRIKSDIRKVQAFQPIYSNVQNGVQILSLDNAFRIPANTTAFFPDARLDDPVISAQVPTIGKKQSGSWFTAKTLSGGEVSSLVDITLTEIRTNSYVMLFRNQNSYDVVIDQIEVWGEPAKIVDTIRYEAYDEESVERYGYKVLGGDAGIENDFFGNYNNCDSFAETIIPSLKDYAPLIEMEVKGNPALQLGDLVSVNHKDYTDTYKVTAITTPIEEGNFVQTIKARRYEVVSYFVLNSSALNGADVLAP